MRVVLLSWPAVVRGLAGGWVGGSDLVGLDAGHELGDDHHLLARGSGDQGQRRHTPAVRSLHGLAGLLQQVGGGLVAIVAGRAAAAVGAELVVRGDEQGRGAQRERQEEGRRLQLDGCTITGQ